jgi:hypothetical protein
LLGEKRSLEFRDIFKIKIYIDIPINTCKLLNLSSCSVSDVSDDEAYQEIWKDMSPKKPVLWRVRPMAGQQLGEYLAI